MKKIILFMCASCTIIGGRADASGPCDELYQQAKTHQGNFEYDEALRLYQELMQYDSHLLKAKMECVRIYAACNDIAQAKKELGKIVDSDIPSDVNTLFSIAHLLLTVGEIDAARMLFEQLYEQHPQVTSLLYNIGYVKKMQGDVDATVEILQKLLAQDPENDNLNFSLGHTYLFQGDFERGWAQHDRFLRRTHRYDPVLREWIENGELAGKRILLRYEGGLGDTVQFLRTAQWLNERGAIVSLRIQKPLVPLLSLCPYVEQITVQGDPVPSCDATATLMTVPALFNATEEIMSKGIPYLSAYQDRVAFWGDYVAHDNKFKIGICWQADVHNDVSRLPVARRGIPLKTLLRIASIPNVSIYILQKKEGLDQLQDIGDIEVHYLGADFDEEYGPFVDTLALMKHLDLVISADTAVPHLAGALGVPVWLLLPYSVDWRWISGRTDSPWYPTMRIFKQPAPFGWDLVMDEVVQELNLIVAST